MASKLTGISSSTPAVANLPSVAFRNGVDSSGPSSIEESSFVMRSVADLSDEPLVKTHILLNKKLSTLDLVLKAIEVVGVPKKGASYIAIQKWIINNKENVVIGRLKANLKKAVIKALENGILNRATVSKNAIGLQGYFIPNKDSLKKKTQIKTSTKKTVAKKKNEDIVERESLSDTEVTRKPRKKNVGRLNKSVTEDGGRKKVSKVNAIAKVKATTALAPKVKNPPASKVKNAPAPKAKNDPAPKAKNPPAPKVKSAPAPKVKNAPAPKVKNAPAPKAKNVPVRKAKTTVAPTTSVPESEIASTSEPSSKSKTIPKPKMAKTKRMADETVLEEPEMMGVKLVQEKSKKLALKPTKQNIRAKKLYTSSNPVSNMSRKDLSDTELTVKPINRKSLKSYSSDTEIDAVKKEKAIKAKGSRIKVANAKKLATEESEAGPSKLPTTSKATRKQKAKNAA